MPTEKLPLPTAPEDVIIKITVDGVETEHDMTPEAIELWNNFMHAQGVTGSFGERMIAVHQKTTEQIAANPEWSPSVKAKQAELEAVLKAAVDSAKPRERARR